MTVVFPSVPRAMRRLLALVLVQSLFALPAFSAGIDTVLPRLPAGMGACAEDPAPALREVLEAQGVTVGWTALCAGTETVAGVDLPGDPGVPSARLAALWQALAVLAPVALVDDGRGVVVRLAGGEAGLAVDIAALAPPPGEDLFPGLAADWLPYATGGGDSAFAGTGPEGGLVVDVPEGHAWATTGIRSARPMVVAPALRDGVIRRLTFRFDPEASRDFIFALVPAGLEDRADWDSHDLRIGIQHTEEAGGPELLVWTRRELRARLPLGGRANPLTAVMVDLRPDGLIVLRDQAGARLVEARLVEDVPKRGWHVFAAASAGTPERAVKLSLLSIRSEPVAMPPLGDPEVYAATETHSVLFDGETIGPRMLPHAARGGDFARDAVLADGWLRVTVPPEVPGGMVGLRSQEPMIWLDRFTDGAEVAMKLTLDPGATNSFVVALARTWNLDGNEPNHPRYAAHIRRDAEGKLRVTRFFDYDTSLTETVSDAAMPATVEVVLTPDGVALRGEGLPDDALPWPELAEGAGFRVYVYAQPPAEGQPGQLALRDLTVTRRPGAPLPTPVPEEGVEPLPVTTFLPEPGAPVWERFAFGGHVAEQHLSEDEAGIVSIMAEEGLGSYPHTGIQSLAPIVDLGTAVEETPYRLSVNIDPEQSDGMEIMFSTTRSPDAWAVSWATVTLMRQPQGVKEGAWMLSLWINNYAVWTRILGPGDIPADWDGTVTMRLGQGWISATLEGGAGGGPTILGTLAPHGRRIALFVTVQSRVARDYGPSRLTIRRVEGGFETPPLMDAAQRMRILPAEDFDPAAYLQAVGADLATEALP